MKLNRIFQLVLIEILDFRHSMPEKVIKELLAS